MIFATLAAYFDAIESTSSRLAMTEKIAELFKETTPDEINKVVYMLQGRVTPPYVKADFGLGEKMIIKAVLKALNLNEKSFTKRFKTMGDIGLSTEKFKKEISIFHAHDESVKTIFNQLAALTKTAGTGSYGKKIGILADLVRTLDPLSTRYVVRIPAQTLRLGFSDMTILDALSWMLTGDKRLRKEIEAAYHVRPDLGYIAQMLKKEGLYGIAKIEPEVGTPIIMMRAQRLPSPEDIIEKLKTGIVEPKYDGFRLQCHIKKGHVTLFSRGLDDVTYMYPDVVEGIRKELKAESAIIEGEAIGFDPYSGSFLPFQETVQRKRKYDIDTKAKEIPLKLFVFELLYLNGKSLLHEPLTERIQLLKKHVSHKHDHFSKTILVSDEKTVNSVKDITLHFDEAIAKGLEGIMIKKKEGLYQPGARGWSWIKYKRSYSSKIDDTIDCLVMGFDRGKGKRAGFGIGAFLVGIYSEQSDTYKTVAKIGTGLSDMEWRTLEKRCTHIAASHKPALYDVDKLMSVDVWVQPEIVVEIKADEITRSPTHTAGRVLKSTKTGKALEVETPGFALRFPRLQRFREDKKPEDVTTVKEVSAMYKEQGQASH